MKLVCDAYDRQGRATIAKVDPPTKVLRIGGKPHVIQLRNPYLDFVGTWTEQGGRMLMFEAKWTSEPVLRILRAGQTGSGISHEQLVTARRFWDAGAVTFFLWSHKDQVRFVTPTMVEATLTARQSLPWLEAHRVPSGEGFVLFDFLTQIQPITTTKTTTTICPTNC